MKLSLILGGNGMEKRMPYAELNRTFDDKHQLDRFLEENPTCQLKMIYGRHGLNAIIQDARLAEVKMASDGVYHVVKWLE
jgi:hypothetical protein